MNEEEEEEQKGEKVEVTYSVLQQGSSGPGGNDGLYLGGSEGLKGIFRDVRASEAAECPRHH